MHNSKLTALALSLALCGSAYGQTTYLSEDFSGGVIPPAGWSEIDLSGINPGWELGSLTGSAAFHDDFSGWNDVHLMSSDMDLTGATSVFLHITQNVGFASWRDHHYVDVSTDSGVTFTNVADDLSPDGTSSLSVDISAYAGINGVAVSFHYTGDFASEWTVDDVVVNDSSTPPPPPLVPWAVNLPTAFRAQGGPVEDFESYGGTPPADMALTSVDYAGVPDADGWCVIDGGSGFGAGGGTACLEMGLDPLTSNYHDVRNAMVLGVQGGAASLTVDFLGIDHGDEIDGADGIWVSNDGANWAHVLGDWWSMSYLSWGPMTDVSLDDSRIDLTADFYIMMQQDDNFPYAYLDGIGIDDIALGGGPPSGPTLAVTNLVAGATANVDCTNCTAGDVAYFVWSAAGGGPVNTPFGTGYVSPPYRVIPLLVDAAGNASMTQSVPPGLTGMNIWFHGADRGSATMLNALAMTIG